MFFCPWGQVEWVRGGERKSSWCACHKHQLFDCDWWRWDLGTACLANCKAQKLSCTLPISSVAARTPEVTLCWSEQLSGPDGEDLPPIAHASVFTLTVFLPLSFSYTHRCQATSTRCTRLSVCETCVHLFLLPLYFLGGSGWGRKMMSLSRKQASCHATKEPSPGKLWSNCSHWLTNFFLSFFFLKIWHYLWGFLQCSSETPYSHNAVDTEPRSTNASMPQKSRKSQNYKRPLE